MSGKHFRKFLSYFSFGLVFLISFPSVSSSKCSENFKDFTDPREAPVECFNLRPISANAAFKKERVSANAAIKQERVSENAAIKQERVILGLGRKDVGGSRTSVKKVAGFLDKLKGDQNEKGGDSKGLGGLFKALKVPTPGQSAMGTQSATQDDSSAFGRYSSASSEIMDLLCAEHKREWSYDYPAPDTSLIAGDFKVSVSELSKVFQDEFYKVKYTSIPNPQTFENGFDSPKIKELFVRFLSEKSPEILSQFKKLAQISSSSTRGMKEQADAQFAYGLLLMQFSDHISDAAQPLQYIKQAWKNDQRGASYLWGALLFYGEAGLRRNVNVAANFVANAQAADEGDNFRGDGGSDAEPFEPFAPATTLLMEISKDPDFKHKEMYASLRADAEKFKQKWMKKKNTGSALNRQATQLNYRSVEALEKLAKALGLGKLYNEVLAEIALIKQERNPSKQLVERSLRVKEPLLEAIGDELEKRDKLDANEIAALQETEVANRIVISQYGATIAQIFMSQMAAGGMISPDTISDWAYTVPILVKGQETSCKVREDLKVAYLNKQEGNQALKETPDTPEQQEKTGKAYAALGEDG